MQSISAADISISANCVLFGCAGSNHKAGLYIGLGADYFKGANNTCYLYPPNLYAPAYNEQDLIRGLARVFSLGVRV